VGFLGLVSALPVGVENFEEALSVARDSCQHKCIATETSTPSVDRARSWAWQRMSSGCRRGSFATYLLH